MEKYTYEIKCGKCSILVIASSRILQCLSLCARRKSKIKRPCELCTNCNNSKISCFVREKLISRYG